MLKSFKFHLSFSLVILLLNISLNAGNTFAPRKQSASTKSITVRTSNAIVWLDEIRRGATDADGKLAIKNVSAGRHSLRVRASGFKETTLLSLLHNAARLTCGSCGRRMSEIFSSARRGQKKAA